MFRCQEPQCLITQVIPTLLNTGFSIYYWHDITPKYALIIITLQIFIALGIQRSIILLSYTQENHFAYALIVTLLFSSVFLINHFVFKVQANAQNYFFIITQCIFLSILFLNLVTLVIFIGSGTIMLILCIIGMTRITNYFRMGQIIQAQQHQQEQLNQQIQIGLESNELESGLESNGIERNGIERNRLKIFPYQDIRNKQYNTCPICLQEFDQNDIVSQLPNCCHFFHQQCISAWLQGKSSCPCCRAVI